MGCGKTGDGKWTRKGATRYTRTDLTFGRLSPSRSSTRRRWEGWASSQRRCFWTRASERRGRWQHGESATRALDGSHSRRLDGSTLGCLQRRGRNGNERLRSSRRDWRKWWSLSARRSARGTNGAWSIAAMGGLALAPISCQAHTRTQMLKRSCTGLSRAPLRR